MCPDIVLSFWRLASILCFVMIALTFFFSPNGKTAPLMQGFMTPAYCMTDSNGPAVYFTAIYDTKLITRQESQATSLRVSLSSI
jgi:hypothetical protein